MSGSVARAPPATMQTTLERLVARRGLAALSALAVVVIGALALFAGNSFFHATRHTTVSDDSYAPVLPVVGVLRKRNADAVAPMSSDTSAWPNVRDAVARASAPVPTWRPQMPVLEWLRALLPLSVRGPTWDRLKFDSATPANLTARSPSADALRVTDEMLVRDMTIVVMYKEAMDIVRLCLPALIPFVPRNITIVAVAGGPCDACRAWIDAFADAVVSSGTAPQFHVVHVPDFTTAARARLDESVRAFCRRKYTLFFNNDVLFGTPHALRELYADAEWGSGAGGDIYLPAVIDVVQGHLHFVHGPEPAAVLSFALSRTGVADMERVGECGGVPVPGDPGRVMRLVDVAYTDMDATPMSCMIEDHIILVRDAHRTARMFLDPYGSATGDAMDYMMNARFAGLRVMYSTRAWFALTLTDVATTNDLPFVTWRRSDYLNAAAIRYQARKWNMRNAFGMFFVSFRMRTIGRLEWSPSRGNIPASACEQLILAASMTVAIGFTGFDVDVRPAAVLGAEGARRNAPWQIAYPALADACRADHDGDPKGPALSLTLRASFAVRWMPEPPRHFYDASRRLVELREGSVFSVHPTDADVPLGGVSQEGELYPKFAMAHVRGLHWNTTGTNALVLLSSLCWSRDAVSTGECLVVGGAGFPMEEAVAGAPEGSVTVIRRETEGMPLDLIDGPVGDFRVLKAAYKLLDSGAPAQSAQAVRAALESAFAVTSPQIATS